MRRYETVTQHRVGRKTRKKLALRAQHSTGRMNSDDSMPPLVRALALSAALREIGAAAQVTGRGIGYDKLLVAEGLGRIRAVIDDWADRAHTDAPVRTAARALRKAASRVAIALRGRYSAAIVMPELEPVEAEARRAAMHYREAHS